MHSSAYKHAFAVDLTDERFNQMYLKVTRYRHVSVNYNRALVECDDEDEREQKGESHAHSLSECDSDHISSIEKCQHLQHIIEALRLYTKCRFKITAKELSLFNTWLLTTGQDLPNEHWFNVVDIKRITICLRSVLKQ